MDPAEEEIESEDSDDGTIQGYIKHLVSSEGVFPSPINVNIATAKSIECPLLDWYHFNIPPKKMKLTNSGFTILVSAKWKEERPYISGGPLRDKYVFSQMHFHWGHNDMNGSEHSTDGIRHSGELHVVMYKSAYITQEAALKEEDGIVIMVYFIRLRSIEHVSLQRILNALPHVKKANTSIKISPFPLVNIIKPFIADFMCYWGSVVTTACTHYVLWFLSRKPIGVTPDQLDQFRQLLDAQEMPLVDNCKQMQSTNDRSIFLVNPSQSRYATLQPFDQEAKRTLV